VSTYGILLPCDGSEPMPIAVGDYQHIQTLVGGLIDCVTVNYDPDDFTSEEADELFGAGERNPFVACGYVNDEGLLEGMPINTMASVVLQRPIVGPCVLVSATSPNGFYDGDNHDLPEWFANAVFQGGLHGLSQTLEFVATIEAEAMQLALDDGLFTEEQFNRIMSCMVSGDESKMLIVEAAVDIAMQYHAGRNDGSIPKFNRAEFENFQESLQLTDDAISKFWEEEERS